MIITNAFVKHLAKQRLYHSSNILPSQVAFQGNSQDNFLFTIEQFFQPIYSKKVVVLI